MACTTSVPLGPFTYTAPGDLGVQRDTMLCNELLIRDRVGQPKTRGLYLPSKGFIYGRPNDKREYTAADALRGYGLGTSSLPFDRPNKQPERDFMALNKATLSAGLVTSKENYDFRATHDIRRKPPAEERRAKTRRLPANMVFGVPTRPCTPIYDILEHKFQDKWISQRRNQELERRKNEKQGIRYSSAPTKKTNLLLYDTRATLLRTFQNPVDPKPLWQMPRFSRSARPHLATFRCDKARDDSFGGFDYEKVSRKGMQGQGIYESALN